MDMQSPTSFPAMQSPTSSNNTDCHSSVFLQLSSQQLDAITSYKDDVTNSTTAVCRAAEQVTSYNYYDGNYTEQEVAVYQHEDDVTKRTLLAQIQANKSRIQELDAMLEMMLLQVDSISQFKSHPVSILLKIDEICLT